MTLLHAAISCHHGTEVGWQGLAPDHTTSVEGLSGALRQGAPVPLTAAHRARLAEAQHVLAVWSFVIPISDPSVLLPRQHPGKVGMCVVRRCSLWSAMPTLNLRHSHTQAGCAVLARVSISIVFTQRTRIQRNNTGRPRAMPRTFDAAASGPAATAMHQSPVKHAAHSWLVYRLNSHLSAIHIKVKRCWWRSL